MSLSEDMSHLAETLRQSYDGRVTAVAELQAATTQQLTDLHAQHSAMAASQRQQLNESAEKLRRDVATLLNDLKVERETMSAEQTRKLDAFTSELQQTTDKQLAEWAAARKAMNSEQRERLDAYSLELRQRTNAHLTLANEARQVIYNDHAAARQAWRRFNAEMRLRRAGQAS
jgi:ABC-type transporter Mla subunit MlaD